MISRMSQLSIATRLMLERGKICDGRLERDDRIEAGALGMVGALSIRLLMSMSE